MKKKPCACDRCKKDKAVKDTGTYIGALTAKVAKAAYNAAEDVDQASFMAYMTNAIPPGLMDAISRGPRVVGLAAADTKAYEVHADAADAKATAVKRYHDATRKYAATVKLGTSLVTMMPVGGAMSDVAAFAAVHNAAHLSDVAAHAAVQNAAKVINAKMAAYTKMLADNATNKNKLEGAAATNLGAALSVMRAAMAAYNKALADAAATMTKNAANMKLTKCVG